MPSSPPIACRCGGRSRDGVCDRCGPRRKQYQRDYDSRRGTSTERGYDYEWQQFRKRYLAEHPLCCDCKEQGVIAGATDVHHVMKLVDHPEYKYDEAWLFGLCKMHHDKRTARGE